MTAVFFYTLPGQVLKRDVAVFDNLPVQIVTLTAVIFYTLLGQVLTRDIAVFDSLPVQVVTAIIFLHLTWEGID